MVEHRDCDRYGLGLKPTRAILLCPWERYFAVFFPVGSGRAVSNFNHISIKLKN